MSEIYLEEEMVGSLEQHFQLPVALISKPGGQGRKTSIYRIGSQLTAVSRRTSSQRAKLEATILTNLGPKGLSPKLLGHFGRLVVQEYIEGDRLPVAMNAAPPDQARAILLRAAQTLIEAQLAAKQAGLVSSVPAIGLRSGWEADLAAAPARLAEALGLELPNYKFGDLLMVGKETRGFNKWDARPGNAILRPDGSVCWIDWEHAGRRRPVDDLVWLLADEWAPVAPKEEIKALQLLALAHNFDTAQLRQQFAAMAVAHSSMRLLLILKRKNNGPWWNYQTCLEKDRVGVTAAHVQHLSARAENWAGAVTGLIPLRKFFAKVAQHRW